MSMDENNPPPPPPPVEEEQVQTHHRTHTHPHTHVDVKMEDPTPVVDEEDATAVNNAVLAAAAEAADVLPSVGDTVAIEAAVAASAVSTTTPTAAPPTKRRRTGGKRSQRPWNDMLFELLKYRAANGNVMVPFKSGGDLGKWVAQQRAQYMALQKSSKDSNQDDQHKKWVSSSQDGPERLTHDRMKVLSHVGFVWDVVQADNDARWARRYEELKEYKALHGHCNVPQSTDLGKWVKMQRENKHEADLKKAGTTPVRKKPKPCLSTERIEKLEAIGFQWRVAKPAVGWENRFNQLVEYKQVHGDCNVPQSYPPDKPFGRWVMKQRCQHSLKLRGEKSQLTDEREKKLNEIGFSWVAPGFSKKTVTMPGDEEEAAAVQQQAAAHAAQQAREHEATEHALAVAQAAAVQHAEDLGLTGQVPVPVHQDEYPTWNV